MLILNYKSVVFTHICISSSNNLYQFNLDNYYCFVPVDASCVGKCGQLDEGRNCGCGVECEIDSDDPASECCPDTFDACIGKCVCICLRFLHPILLQY